MEGLAEHLRQRWGLLRHAKSRHDCGSGGVREVKLELRGSWRPLELERVGSVGQVQCNGRERCGR